MNFSNKTNMKQTAVEWFYQRILAKDIKEVYEQAKEMEKEQIIDAYKFGIQDEYVIGSQRYYNETFKSE